MVNLLNLFIGIIVKDIFGRIRTLMSYLQHHVNRKLWKKTTKRKKMTTMEIYQNTILVVGVTKVTKIQKKRKYHLSTMFQPKRKMAANPV